MVDANGAFAPGADPYDPDCGAGCVALRVDLAAEKLLTAAPALTGTLVNCAGGVTPWGTWISCEEIVVGRDQVRPTRPGGPDARLTKIHGLAFEVSADGKTRARPVPDMGQFRHEAVAFDATTGQAYLTEALRGARRVVDDVELGTSGSSAEPPMASRDETNVLFS